MHTLKLKKFDILVNDDTDSIIAVQSGRPLNSPFNDDLIRTFELKLDAFLANFEEIVSVQEGFKILDIGAGNSLFDIALAKNFPNLNLNFVLVDGDNFNDAVAPEGVHYSGYQPYNSWSPVFENIKANGLDVSKFQPIDHKSEYWGWPGSFDVVMSTSSWGWHYPIETYLEKVYNLLKPGGYLIIRPLIRMNNYIETVNNLFGLPLFLRGFTFKRIQGTVKSNEEQHWVNLVNPTGPNHVMFYHAIWQKPLSDK